MNIMKFLYIASTCLIMSMIGFTLVAIPNIIFSQSPDSLTFDDPLLGVKFQYTNEWVEEGSSLYGATTECPSLPCVRLPEVSVTTSPTVFEDFLLSNYTKQQSLYHEEAAGYDPIALNETKIGEIDAFQYVYSTTSPFLSENEEIVYHEIYTTEGINLYKVTFTALRDEQYGEYLNSFKKMIDTFEIVK